MNVIFFIGLLSCFVTICIDFLLIVCWALKTTVSPSTVSNYPKISVLIAARNEEDNIERCLESLLCLDYPEDKLEILVGDDQSKDNTFEIANRYAERNDNFGVRYITHNIGHAHGKANVLAHLGREAKGDFFFITDADTAVPKSWIKDMLAAGGKNTGIVTGVTGIQKSSLQNLDWIFALGMIKVITDLGQPVTAMGNNMCVSRRAYEAVGGYETLPFSITEDFELFKQVRKKGFGVVQLFQPGVLAYSKPVLGVSAILHQRKRWIKGAMQLPWMIISLLFFQALYYPLIVLLTFIDPETGIFIILLKILLQSVFIRLAEHRLKKRSNIINLIFYEAYAFGLSILSSIFFLLPLKTIWKGRKY